LFDHRIDGLLQPVGALALSEDCDACAKLYFGYGRDEKISRVMNCKPVQNGMCRFGAH